MPLINSHGTLSSGQLENYIRMLLRPPASPTKAFHILAGGVLVAFLSLPVKNVFVWGQNGSFSIFA